MLYIITYVIREKYTVIFFFLKVCNIAHVLNERTKNIFSKKKKEKEILFVSP